MMRDELQDQLEDAISAQEKKTSKMRIARLEPMPSILEEARDIVNGPRQSMYGLPDRSFSDIGRIASLLFNDAEWTALEQREFLPSAVCKVLMSVKLQRESVKHQRDNLVDLCGYADILHKLEEGKRGV